MITDTIAKPSPVELSNRYSQAKMYSRDKYIGIFCGEGAGKTSATIGRAVRASGEGMRTCIVQFLKDTNTGEYKCLADHPKIDIYPCGPNGKITFNHNKNPSDIALAQRGWELVKNISPNYDIMFLDEFLTTLDFGEKAGERLDLIPLQEAVDWLDNKPSDLYVFMSGRYIPEPIRERAGFISRIEQEKHWFPKVLARRGIEY